MDGLAYTVYLLVKAALATIISGICLARAAKFDARAKRSAVWNMVALGMFAFGIGISMLMPDWMRHACILGFMAAICGMLLEGEKRWRQGPPDDLLRHEHQWPQSDRRKAERRRDYYLSDATAAEP